MTKTKSIFMLLCVCVWLISCSTLAPLKPSGQCIPDFPYKDGWYGGDGAYSIQIDERRTLWLFGDTFAAEDTERKDRIGMDIVMGNTLAVSICSADQKFSIQYFLKKKDGKFLSFFGESEWLWPQDPFVAKNELYIPLLIVQGVPDAPAPFNFKIAGHKIARIRNYKSDNPYQWTVDYLDWTGALPEGIEALATTSIVYQDHIYFFPLYRITTEKIRISGNILARVPVEHLDKPLHTFEYLNRDGKWVKELSPEKVKIVFDAAVSELSVRYHTQDRQWLAIYLSPANKGSRLLYQTAPELEGPWSKPEALIESIAEVNPASHLYDKNTFCYAGKEHRQFARERAVIVTYVCNSSEDLNQQTTFLRKNLFLYRPVVKNIIR